MKKIELFLIIFTMFFLVACGSDTNSNITTEIETSNLSETNTTTAQEKEKEKIILPDKEEETIEETETSEVSTTKETKAVSPNLEQLQVHFIDVGQADATLLQYTDENKTYNILYDAGDWRGNQVVSYLLAHNVTSLDLVVISHPDADHIGQLDKVMQSIPVGEVWMSGNESSSQTFQRAMQAVLASDADYHEPSAGEGFDIGPLAIDVLYPNGTSGKSNEESISILFTYGTVKFLFTGDADRSGETSMRNNFNVAANVLHLGHHGSNTSSDPAFIDAVSPSIAIYSAGANNSYGHPSPDVVSTVLDRDITLYGTDKNGTIVIKTNGKKIDSIETGGAPITASKATPPKAEPSKPKTESKPAAKAEPAKPKAESKPPAKEPEPESQAPAGCIDINSASVDEVQGIKHIGPARAPDLISLRPYNSVDDLDKISGIGPARIADIKAEGKACVR